jgi:hypothetical protein
MKIRPDERKFFFDPPNTSVDPETFVQHSLLKAARKLLEPKQPTQK